MLDLDCSAKWMQIDGIQMGTFDKISKHCSSAAFFPISLGPHAQLYTKSRIDVMKSRPGQVIFVFRFLGIDKQGRGNSD